MGEGQFSRPWSGTALRAIVPATGLRGSWSRLWPEMCLHTCDQPPGGWLCPLVNSPAEPSTWTPYRNTNSAAPGFSLFQLKFFNSLHLIGLFVANKPATQGGAEGVLPHQVLGLDSGRRHCPGAGAGQGSATCAPRMEGKGPSLLGEALGWRQWPTGQFLLQCCPARVAAMALSLHCPPASSGDAGVRGYLQPPNDSAQLWWETSKA